MVGTIFGTQVDLNRARRCRRIFLDGALAILRSLLSSLVVSAIGPGEDAVLLLERLDPVVRVAAYVDPQVSEVDKAQHEDLTKCVIAYVLIAPH